VIVVGRPVGGANQDLWVEVTRCCTDETRNACSFLYGAAARAAKALGFIRIQTYILAAEDGASLKASGWVFDRLSHPVGWHHDGPRAARTLRRTWAIASSFGIASSPHRRRTGCGQSLIRPKPNNSYSRTSDDR